MDENTFWAHSDADIVEYGPDEICGICEVIQPWWRETGRSKHLLDCNSIDAESEINYEELTQFIVNDNPPSDEPLVIQNLPKWLTYIEHGLTGNVRKDEIHLGETFCGSITMPGQFRKNVYLQTAQQFPVFVEEFRKRISPSINLLIESPSWQNIQKVSGLNTLEPVWQDINLQYKKFVRNQLLDLFRTLGITPEYEELLNRRIKNIYQSTESHSRFESLLRYRMQFYNPGFYVVEQSGYVNQFDPVADDPFKEIESKQRSYGEQIFYVYELPKRANRLVMNLR